jgi:hypothetical protein
MGIYHLNASFNQNSSTNYIGINNIFDTVFQQRQDANKDGTITKDEYIAWFCDEEGRKKLNGNH